MKSLLLSVDGLMRLQRGLTFNEAMKSNPATMVAALARYQNRDSPLFDRTPSGEHLWAEKNSYYNNVVMKPRARRV